MFVHFSMRADDAVVRYLHHHDSVFTQPIYVFDDSVLVSVVAVLVYNEHLIRHITGFPILTHFLKKTPSTNGGFNLGGINATGQVPKFPNNFGLIDKDTPHSAYTKPSYFNGEDMILVFSDEFNEDGRSFYPGDDPFWEAVDLHYWGTVSDGFIPVYRRIFDLSLPPSERFGMV